MIQFCISNIHQILVNEEIENGYYKFIIKFHKRLITTPLKIFLLQD